MSLSPLPRPGRHRRLNVVPQRSSPSVTGAPAPASGPCGAIPHSHSWPFLPWAASRVTRTLVGGSGAVNTSSKGPGRSLVGMARGRHTQWRGARAMTQVDQAGSGYDIPEEGRKADALGLLSGTVIALASVAPAYSLAATIGFVVIAVGLQAPVIMVLAFIPMYCVAVGYSELNKTEPDAGTTFTWASRAFGPKTGWMGGWAIVAADVIVMANLAAIAGSYFFLLFNADTIAGQTFWPTVVGVAWIVLMTYICYVGIEISARVQYALLGVELGVLTLFSLVALIRVYADNAIAGASLHPQWSWFNPFHISDFGSLATGMLLAVFI